MNRKKNRLDIVVPIVKVDLPTFRNNLPYIQKYLPVKRIVLIGAKEIGGLVDGLDGVTFFDEDKVIPGLSLNCIKQIKKDVSGTERRAGWYYQQFLKMAYAEVCTDDYYLIWDSDTIPIKDIDFFDDNGRPYLDYREHVKYDDCFFRTQDLLFPNRYLHKEIDSSFICEHLLVNVKIMKELLYDLKHNASVKKGDFYKNILYTIPSDIINLSGFSEFETYAAYVLKRYPQSHTLRHWKNLRNAGIYIGNNVNDNNTKWISPLFDVISIEDFNPQWSICKLLLSLDKKHKIEFLHVYNSLQWFYNLIYDIRFKIRNVLKR